MPTPGRERGTRLLTALSGVGSPIWWVIYLLKIRDPTRPLGFSPSRLSVRLDDRQ